VTHREEDDKGALIRLLALARELGVEMAIVDTDPHPSTVGVLLEACDELRRRGIPLPKQLQFLALDDDRTVASYQDVDDRLVVNTASRFWRDPIRSMSLEAGTGYLVSDDPRAIVYHEIGHALHRRRYRVGWRWWSASSKPLRDSERAIAERVSRYATEDTGEFIAEVFAGLLCGRTFDDEVVRLYRDLKGPEP
jgi:hypothetical protein